MAEGPRTSVIVIGLGASGRSVAERLRRRMAELGGAGDVPYLEIDGEASSPEQLAEQVVERLALAEPADPLQMPHSHWDGETVEEQIELDLQLTGALSEWAKGFFAGSTADWVAVAGSLHCPEVVASGSDQDWPDREQVARWVEEREGRTVCVLGRPPVVYFSAAGEGGVEWRGVGGRRPALTLGLSRSPEQEQARLTGILDTGTVHTHVSLAAVVGRLDFGPLERWGQRTIGPFALPTRRCRLEAVVDFGVGQPVRKAFSSIYQCQGLSDTLHRYEGELFDGLFGTDLLTGPPGGGVEVLLDGRTRTTRVVAVHAGA